MNRIDREGFTLVELLVVLILGTLALLATYQVLATSTRVYAVNGARTQGQQMLRGGLDVLVSELREISPKEGDLIGMAADSLTFRAQRTFGVACAINYAVTPVEITAYQVGPPFLDGDSIFVFHDNDPDRASDDEWFGGVVSSVDTSPTCSDGSPAQALRIPFLRTTATKSPPDSVRIGAPVRGFESYTYGQVTVDGEAYLGRRAWGATDTELIVGPLPEGDGLAFRYLDQSGNETTVDTLVSQIEVLLRYESALRGFTNQVVSDSVLVRVYPRN
jgi:prepilin-type N-terminal cleavage/methylation domain-containing protein